MSAKWKERAFVAAIVLVAGCGYYPNPWALDEESSDSGSTGDDEVGPEGSSVGTSLDEIGSLGDGDDDDSGSDEGELPGPGAWETFVEMTETLDDLAVAIQAAHAESAYVPKRCPHPIDMPIGGHAGVTPPLAVNCYEGVDYKCHADPEFDPDDSAPGDYDAVLWKTGMWGQISFMRESHYAHYDFYTVNQSSGGLDECSFTVYGWVDLDNDGEFTGYSRDYRYDGVDWIVGDLIKQTYP